MKKWKEDFEKRIINLENESKSTKAKESIAKISKAFSIGFGCDFAKKMINVRKEYEAQMDKLKTESLIVEFPNVSEALESKLSDILTTKEFEGEVSTPKMAKEITNLKNRVESRNRTIKRGADHIVELEAEIKNLSIKNKVLANFADDAMDRRVFHVKENEAYNQAIDDISKRLNKDSMIGAGIRDMINGLKKK